MYQFITPSDTLDLEIIRDSRASGHDSEGHRLRVFVKGVSKGEFRITVTLTARNGDVANGAFESDRIDETLISLVRSYLVAGQYEGELSVNSGNVEQLLTVPHASEARIELDVAVALYRLLKGNNIFSFPHQLITRSVGFHRDAVIKALRYLIQCDILKYGDISGENFSTIQGAIPRLEEAIARGIVERFPPAGYFREIPLSGAFLNPFVFVLMPFNENEFPQRRYDQLMKPLLEKAVGIPCFRADEKQGYFQISDQIYSQILAAKAIVAEISSENANVMLEVGVALAHRKPVFVLFDNSMLSKPAFYLEKIAYHSYSDDETLESELVKVAARISNISR